MEQPFDNIDDSLDISAYFNNEIHDTSANTANNSLYNSNYNKEAAELLNTTPEPARNIDAIDLEYTHYTHYIKTYFMSISDQQDKSSVLKWIHLLSSPTMALTKNRERRNHSLFVLSIAIAINQVGDTMFSLEPVSSEFIVNVPVDHLTRGNWEATTFWQVEFASAQKLGILLPDTCICHGKSSHCDATRQPSLEATLDDQFKLFLYIVKDTSRALKKPHDRILVASWVQMLCAINEKACIRAKGIRNDYIMLLAGYLHYELLLGVFTQPPTRPLEPILRSIKFQKHHNAIPITDPTNPRVAEFMKDLPIPTEGAFAFMALTGEMYELN